MRPSADAATSGSVATPIETVSLMSRPSPWRKLNAATRSRMRSPDRGGAFAARVRQDQRELVAAEARDHVRLARAQADDAGRFDQRAAPEQMAVRVVDRLEPVEIDEQQRQRPAAARRALGLAAQHLREIARVVQLRQIVGDRQRLRPLHAERVLERDRARLEPAEQRRERARRKTGRAPRGDAIDGHERADRTPPARQRERRHRRERGVAHASILGDVGGREQLAAADHPAADRVRRGLERRRQPAGRHRTRAPSPVNREHQPPGRRNPVRHACHEGVGDLFGVEARVHRANHVG